MISHSRKKTRLWTNYAALLRVMFLLVLPACQPKTEESPARTEPWRRQEAGTAQEKEAKALRYEVEPGQSLHWDLRGRKARPQGTVGGITGSVEVRLHLLEKTTGTVRFDLSSLLVEGSSEPPEDWTAEAKRWLGLGARDATKFARASFEIESLRDLSHRLPHKAARRSREDGKAGEVRRLYATAVGKLMLRSLSVDRKIPLTVEFYYAEPATADTIPDRIVAELRGGPQVPLEEYEIMPRDGLGNLVSEKLGLLGQEVGRTARMNGRIAFQRSQP
jgi:hypothetical protein